MNPGTIGTWLALLAATVQWHELPAFAGNTLKRVTGRHKGHLADTGLACALQRITNPESHLVSRLAGSLFESFVLPDLWSQCTALGLHPHFTTGVPPVEPRSI